MNDLSIGDWRIMKFGFEEHEWYVYRVTENKVQIGLKGWLVSSSIWMDKAEFIKKSEPVGRGKFRWWWLLLPGFNDCVCPFTKAK